MIVSFLKRQSKTDLFLLLIAITCLIAPAVQYPLLTTFPIGGDAAAHINTVQHLTESPFSTLRHITLSWYPVTYTLFSLNAFIPFITWTDIYTWWMALGQIVTGLALGFLLFRLGGVRAAAIGIALWGITPITLTSFFEDATMAQLWSLPWLILFFERMTARSSIGMVFFFFLALLSHPITGLIILTTVILTAPLTWITNPKIDAKDRTLRKIYTFTALTASVFAAYIFATRFSVFSIAFRFESSRYLQELFHGFFLPWTLASIYGWYLFIQAFRDRFILIISLSSFFFVSILLAANDQLGIGFWTNRLNAYVTICIIIGAAIGFSRMLDALRPKLFTMVFATTLLIALTGSVINDNQNIYKRNESTTITTRINQNELDAIAWLNEYVSTPANVLSSAATRHYEWIPVLSDLSWNEINSPHPIYYIFFTRTEKVPEHVWEQGDRFRMVYRNQDAVIFSVTPQ